MKRTHLLFILSLFVLTGFAEAEKPIRILFIGNSLTSSGGGVDRWTQAVFESCGRLLETEKLTYGGQRVQEHVCNNLGEPSPRQKRGMGNKPPEDTAKLRETIASRKGRLDALLEQPWDVIVFQGINDGESLDPGRDGYATYATLMVEKLRAAQPGARIALYMQ